MAAIKSCTGIEQSRKLAEFLPHESAGMCFIAHSELINIHEPFYKKADKEDIPCWSLAALLGVLPKFDAEEPMVRKLYYANEPKERYICQYNLTNMTSEYDNPVDACYEMILKLNELNLL